MIRKSWGFAFFYLFFLQSAHSSVAHLNDPNVVGTCRADYGDGIYTDLTIRRIQRSVLAFDVVETYRSGVQPLKRHILRTFGRVNMGWNDPRFSVLAGKDPLLGLVDDQNPGSVYAFISTQVDPSRPGVFAMELSVNRGGIEKFCNLGPAFTSFAAENVATAPLVERELMLEYMDNKLALVCRPRSVADGSQIYKVRGLSFGFARSEVQVKAVGPEEGSGLRLGFQLDSFTQTRDEIHFRKADGTILYPPQPDEVLFVIKKRPGVDAQGKKIYFTALYDGSGGAKNLVCSPRWSFESDVLKPARDAASGRP